MKKKLIKVALVGKTNAGKSTLVNSFVGEKISIVNKKINTTQDLILGILNIDTTQIIFYDTPGSNFLKTSNLLQKKNKTHIWSAIDQVNLILYIIDSSKYNYQDIESDINKISEVNKSIILVFNKIDLIENEKILFYINELKKINFIESFFNISAKYNKGITNLSNYLRTKSITQEWLYKNDEITNKDDIFITNECTRNAILEFLHQEIPYNIKVRSLVFKYLKNHDLKIKQSIELQNERYKPIILGKKGNTIKRIRENSQNAIHKILNCKVHLYLQVNINNDR
jgi:GTP-binding protein Era